MKLNNLEITKNIALAKEKQKLGQFKEAEKIYLDLLSINKNSFDLTFSYAIFCKDLKKFVTAKQLLVNLTKKFPSLIKPYISIAEILRIERRFVEAEKVLLMAQNIDSSNSDLMYNFSLLYSSINKYDLSLVYIDKAINLSQSIEMYKILKADLLIRKSQLDEAFSLLNTLNNSINNYKQLQIKILTSEIFIRQKRYHEAEQILLELIKNFSNSKIGYLNLSNLYLITKELDKGVNILKRGLSISQNYIPFYKNLALIYRSTGDSNLAKDCHLKIIKNNKLDFNSYYELSIFYDFKDHPEELKFLLNTNINQLDQSSKILAAFAISNLYHRSKEYIKSSSYLKIANNESLKSNESSFKTRINNAEFFKSIKIKKPRCQISKNHNQFIFIVGMPRSGSTLLENILSLNNQVIDMGEIDFLEESLKENKDIEKVFNSYSKKREENFKSSSIVTDKNLFNYIYCSIIYNYFPNAKIIHCMRNPLDNILSIYRTKFRNQTFSFSLNDITNLYVHHFEIMQEYKKKYGEIIYEYNYEALARNPSLEIPKIIDWLGWKWDEAYLSPQKNTRNVFTASSSQVRQKIYSSSIGIWKEYKELLAPSIEIINKNKLLKERI